MTKPTDESQAALEAGHTPEAIQARLDAGPSHNDLRDFIFGAIDGTVTTFAVVSSVSGANLTAGVLIILGLANLVADGFSMAISNFLQLGPSTNSGNAHGGMKNIRFVMSQKVRKRKFARYSLAKDLPATTLASGRGHHVRSRNLGGRNAPGGARISGRRGIARASRAGYLFGVHACWDDAALAFPLSIIWPGWLASAVFLEHRRCGSCFLHHRRL